MSKANEAHSMQGVAVKRVYSVFHSAGVDEHGVIGSLSCHSDFLLSDPWYTINALLGEE